jgi:hypothetical protein
MATYGESYYKVLESISNDYLPLHNLNRLRLTDQKIHCYTQHQQHPHEYYACYLSVEKER